MNIEHKKTTLDDNSAFYEKNKDVVTKEDIKNLTPKQKLQYFIDYHLKKVIVIGAVAVYVFILLNSMFFNRKEILMTVAFLNECSITETEKLEEDLRAYLEIEDKNDSVGSSYYNTEDYQMNMAFYTHVAGSGIDLIVCTRSTFEENAKHGMLYDLSTYLPEDLFNNLSDQILTAQVADESDDEGNVLSYFDPQPFGIDISNNEYYKELGGTNPEDLVLCIAAGSKNTDNTIKLLSELAD